MLPPESLYSGSDGSWHSSIGSIKEFKECFVSGKYTSDSLSSGTPPGYEISTEQYQTLLDLFDHASGASWSRSDRWGIGDPCSNEWFGVVCDCDRNVIGLLLPNNGLTGFIPGSILNLQFLRVLDLHSSVLSPQFDGNSIALNSLSGIVPTLSNLIHLIVLDLSGNRIAGFASDLSSNVNLEILSLAGNALSVFPTGLEYLSKLRIFEVRDNIIEDSVPTAAICGMSDIFILDIGNNTLSGSFYDPCLESLNPLVFDLSAPHPWTSDPPTGLTGTVPASMVSSWTNIKNGYLSLYLQFSIDGHFASACSGVRFCRPSNFMSHDDLAWTQGGSGVPQTVYQSIQLAGG